MKGIVCKKNQKGITLVEVIVALVIFGIIGTAVLQAFTTSSKVNRKAKVADGATQSANNIMESFKTNPELFIKDNKLTPVPTGGSTSSAVNNNYTGSVNYDYHWNKSSNKVDNGYTAEYSIAVNKNLGKDTTYMPGSLDDNKFKLNSSCKQYLLVMIDNPTYWDYAKNGGYNIALLENWTAIDYKDWVYNESSPRSYRSWTTSNEGTDMGGTTISIKNYDGYKSSGDATYRFFAMNNLLRMCLPYRHSLNCEYDDSMANFVEDDIGGSRCHNGTVSLKISEGDINLSSGEKYNITVMNESKLALNLYFAASSNEKTKKMEECINVDIDRGAATTTKIVSGQMSQSGYSMNINIRDNKTKKIIYTLSSDEYVAN